MQDTDTVQLDVQEGVGVPGGGERSEPQPQSTRGEPTLRGNMERSIQAGLKFAKEMGKEFGMLLCT